MYILTTILNSSIIMWTLALVCAIMCIRALFHGIMGGTSTILRIVATLVFGFLAYYFWAKAPSFYGSNAIDKFVLDTWNDTKNLWFMIRNKF